MTIRFRFSAPDSYSANARAFKIISDGNRGYFQAAFSITQLQNSTRSPTFFYVQIEMEGYITKRRNTFIDYSTTSTLYGKRILCAGLNDT